MNAKLCAACARPLKDKNVIKGGKPTIVKVCKSPICRKFGEAQ